MFIPSCCFCSLYRRCYIRFIRKVYEKKGAEGQEETRKAFDFMLSHVGVFFLSDFYNCYFGTTFQHVLTNSL